MIARSIEIDRDGQKTTLGRVVVDDENKAMEFMEVVGGERQLLEAVRKLRRTGLLTTLTRRDGAFLCQRSCRHLSPE
jgi:hypothetical protein